MGHGMTTDNTQLYLLGLGMSVVAALIALGLVAVVLWVVSSGGITEIAAMIGELI